MTIQSHGTVSIVMASYNSLRTVDRAIESVFLQTYTDWQLIIVDDASTDASPQLIETKRRGREERITLIRMKQNGGPATARNLGLAASTGEWVAVIDSDDAWREDRLELLVSRLDQTRSDGICDNLAGFDEASPAAADPLFGSLPAVLDVSAAVAAHYDGSYNLGYLKPVLRLGFLKQHRLRYNEELRTGEDLVFLLDILIHRGKIVCSDQATYIYTLPTGNSGVRRSQSTTVPRGDEALSRSLRSLLDRHGSDLTAGEHRAIEQRIAFLDDISPFSEFRSALQSGDWRRALTCLLTEASVRRKLLETSIRRITRAI